MSCDLYVKRAVKEAQRNVAKANEKPLPNKTVTPLTAGYHPELDATLELDDAKANYFQGFIGVLRWMIELGRIDIMVSIAMLSRYLANPREGHLSEAKHVFAYLKALDRSSLIFDYQDMPVDESHFHSGDWSRYYPDAQEAIPLNAPGQLVSMSCFVVADHAGCHVTRRSHTGILIYVQNAPIIWYSKRQNTMESSMFGSEFIAMKIAVEQVEAI
jgi:hypothetical protein